MGIKKEALFSLKSFIRTILIIIVLLVFLIPIIFLIGGSFKTQREFYLTSPSLFPQASYREESTFSTVITKEETGLTDEEIEEIQKITEEEISDIKSIWFNYESIFLRAGQRVRKGIIDSFIISIVSTILTMLISVPAAYSLARYRPGGTQISFFILSILFLPPIVGVLPLFFIFKTLGILDTYWVFFISYLFINLPFATWIMKGFFEDVPLELEQAAMVDGYTRFKVFFKVSIPLAKSGIAVAGLFAFIFSWNELLFSSIFSRSAVQTLPLVLQDYIGSTGNPWGELFAASTISMIPAALLALFMQRYIIRGLSLGEVKY
jgi:multiple sugar transport system permease protein